MVATRHSLPSARAKSPSPPIDTSNMSKAAKRAIEKLAIHGEGKLKGDDEEEKTEANGYHVYHYRGASYMIKGDEPPEWMEQEPERWKRDKARKEEEERRKSMAVATGDEDDWSDEEEEEPVPKPKRKYVKRKARDSESESDDATPKPRKRRRQRSLLPAKTGAERQAEYRQRKLRAQMRQAIEGGSSVEGVSKRRQTMPGRLPSTSAKSRKTTQPRISRAERDQQPMAWPPKKPVNTSRLFDMTMVGGQDPDRADRVHLRFQKINEARLKSLAIQRANGRTAKESVGPEGIPNNVPLSKKRVRTDSFTENVEAPTESVDNQIIERDFAPRPSPPAPKRPERTIAELKAIAASKGYQVEPYTEEEIQRSTMQVNFVKLARCNSQLMELRKKQLIAAKNLKQALELRKQARAEREARELAQQQDTAENDDGLDERMEDVEDSGISMHEDAEVEEQLRREANTSPSVPVQSREDNQASGGASANNTSPAAMRPYSISQASNGNHVSYVTHGHTRMLPGNTPNRDAYLPDHRVSLQSSDPDGSYSDDGYSVTDNVSTLVQPTPDPHDHADAFKNILPTDHLPSVAKGGQEIRWTLQRNINQEGRAEYEIFSQRLHGESPSAKRRRYARELAVVMNWERLEGGELKNPPKDWQKRKEDMIAAEGREAPIVRGTYVDPERQAVLGAGRA